MRLLINFQRSDKIYKILQKHANVMNSKEFSTWQYFWRRCRRQGFPILPIAPNQFRLGKSTNSWPSDVWLRNDSFPWLTQGSRIDTLYTPSKLFGYRHWEIFTFLQNTVAKFLSVIYSKLAFSCTWNLKELMVYTKHRVNNFNGRRRNLLFRAAYIVGK